MSLFKWSSSKVSPIAVDFGVDSLKMLQIVNTDPPQLVAAFAAPVPDTVRGDPQARHLFFHDTLKRALKTLPFRGKRAICAIPAFQTLVQQVSVQRGELDNVDGQIDLQLRQRLNVNTSRMVIRHFEVCDVRRDGSMKQERLVIAASREAVMHYIDTATRAKLDVVGMHSEPMLLPRAFQHLYRRQEDRNRCVCFVDIGAATTKVVITHGQKPVFAKLVHVGGDQFTRHVCQSMGVSFSDAKRMRMDAAEARQTEARRTESDEITRQFISSTAGLHGQSGGGTTVAGRELTVQEAIPEEPLDCLIDELQLSQRYHRGLFEDVSIEKLVFLGGESRHAPVCQAIARAMNIGAQLGDPLARLVRLSGKASGLDLDRPQPGWAAPMGLCLSEANL